MNVEYFIVQADISHGKLKITIVEIDQLQIELAQAEI